MLTAIVGINWGDEGKGRIVDLMSETQDIVVRYQGGNNAGHTVVNDGGTFILNLLPSGILRPGVTCVMGPGMVIDLSHLTREIAALREKGVSITPDNLKISDKAVMTLPYHVALDKLEESRLAGDNYGSTQKGIAPAYGDKYMKKAIRVGELRDVDSLIARLEKIVEFKNLTIENVYHADRIDLASLCELIKQYRDEFGVYICDTAKYLLPAERVGKNIMFEAQLGALRDIDFGIYPFTSSSSTISAYAPIGAGIPGSRIDRCIGIMKAYSSCVGNGPFTVEMDGAEAAELREAGHEYGAATGRPRRVGAFDVVASRYGVTVQRADEIAFTKLDILSYMDKIPVCVAYEVDGAVTEDFPMNGELERAKPVYEYLDGWMCDISSCRAKSDLPENAVKYIDYIEGKVGCKITLVSVGAEREAYLMY
jgi:adenylosuccinate synthase